MTWVLSFLIVVGAVGLIAAMVAWEEFFSIVALGAIAVAVVVAVHEILFV